MTTPAGTINSQLFAKVGRLERDQVDLRVQMGQRTLEQDRLLYTARRTTGEVQALLSQANQRNDQRELLIAQMEGQLNVLLHEKNGLTAQLNAQTDQIEINQNVINDLRDRIQVVNRRIGDLGQQLVDERIDAVDENRFTFLTGERKRIKALLRYSGNVGYNGGILTGGLFGALFGPIGFFVGLFGGAVGGAAFISCHVRDLYNELNAVDTELNAVCRRLGIEVPN